MAISSSHIRCRLLSNNGLVNYKMSGSIIKICQLLGAGNTSSSSLNMLSSIGWTGFTVRCSRHACRTPLHHFLVLRGYMHGVCSTRDLCLLQIGIL